MIILDYNVGLYNKHFVPKRTPIIKLSELMKIVLEQDGYMGDDENKKPEAIFITSPSVFFKRSLISSMMANFLISSTSKRISGVE